MKNLLFSLFCILFVNAGFAQTTATDFTATDCNNVSHNLFSELNSGKVVVIAWVMPCSSCISAARSAHDAVQSFATSHPGQVVFYLVDDYNNTSCTTLKNWAQTNQMPGATAFKSAVISMSDYGTDGMPKVVVLGGWGHKIFYNENDGANTAGIQPAITQALNTISGVEEESELKSKTLFPSYVNSGAELQFSIAENSVVKAEIVNILGVHIKNVKIGTLAPGNHSSYISVSELKSGIYFLRLYTGNNISLVRFTKQ